MSVINETGRHSAWPINYSTEYRLRLDMAIDKVFNRLNALPEEEFNALITTQTKDPTEG